jgi:asparagine synthase (glutamine-hydrolysing)
VNAAVASAVRRQLVSDVPVGAFLSGGIDSPLVVAKAQASRRKLRTYSIGTNGDSHDESVQAATYAKELAATHSVEHASADTALELIDDVIEATAKPFADYSTFPTLLVSRLASREVKVALSGDGGDELFWGYAARFASVLQRAPKFAQPFWLRNAQRALRRVTGIGQWESYRAMPSIGAWYATKHSRIPDSWLSRLFPEARASLRPPEFFEFSGHNIDQTAN